MMVLGMFDIYNYGAVHQLFCCVLLEIRMLTADRQGMAGMCSGSADGGPSHLDPIDHDWAAVGTVHWPIQMGYIILFYTVSDVSLHSIKKVHI